MGNRKWGVFLVEDTWGGGAGLDQGVTVGGWSRDLWRTLNVSTAREAPRGYMGKELRIHRALLNHMGRVQPFNSQGSCAP